MKRFSLTILLAGLFAFTPLSRADTGGSITLKTDFKIWELNLDKVSFVGEYSKSDFFGMDIKLEPEDESVIAPYLQNHTENGIDLSKLRIYLKTKIAPEIDRDKEDVIIKKDDKGQVIFEGRGLYGRKLDIEKAAIMIREAIEKGVRFVHLPLITKNPTVTVLDDSLKSMGIQELVSSGETFFAGSPANRRNNIRVGLSRFNGAIVKPGEEFIFGNVLGPVNEKTGYLPELVIKGDRTVPEYGGGLCQVSTTAYRAVLAAGFPVTKRQNHSFAVQYYSPIGLDATVYPPTVDLKFVNDSKSHLLMQSFMDGDKAFYNFYGTKDPRNVVMIGPFYTGHASPPAPRTEYTTDLAPGETKKLGSAVPGVNAAWYRAVDYLDDTKKDFLDTIKSKYQARPLFYAVGVASEASATEGVEKTF